jgi:hypothetical protein
MLVWTFFVLSWVALWVHFQLNRAPGGWTPTVCPPSTNCRHFGCVEVACGRYPSGFV